MSRMSPNLSAGLILIGWLAGSPTAQAAAPPDGADPHIAHWVRELDDDAFAVREGAHRRLQQAGKRALPALAAAAASESLEVNRRVFRILQRLLASEDESTARATEEALSRLIASPHARASTMARSLL